MNGIQKAMLFLAGQEDLPNQTAELQSNYASLQSSHEEMQEGLRRVESMNAYLERQLEDIDYLNLFETGEIQDVIPTANRKHTILRLRRLRHENPLAKQAIRLIVRFTLGKGVELIIGPDPDKKQPLPPLAAAGASPSGSDNPPDGTGKVRNFPQVSKQPATEASAGGGGISSPPASPLAVSGIVTNFPDTTDTDALKDQITAFWRDTDNQRALTSRASMQEWIDEVATDGEKFFVGFEGPAEPYVKLTEIPMEQIDTIIYDPDNWKKPVYYLRSWIEKVYDSEAMAYVPKNGGNPTRKYYLDYRVLDEELPDLRARIKIKADELAPIEQRVFHTFINPLWTRKGKRGISELYASREWFRVYKEFMEDRAAINAAATSIAYQRKIKGGPTEVAKFTNKLGGLTVGYDPNGGMATYDISKLTRPSPAATYDSNPAVDLQWMKTDTGAINAKEDGRSIITAAGAGVGMFVHYFGDGGDANLATAQAMELPMVKTFEDWQQWTEDALLQLCFWVIRVASDYETAQKQIDRIAGNFPPIHGQDVVKYMTAWSQLTQNVASGNRVVKREAIKGGLTVMDVPNIDALMNEIDAEEAQLEIQRQAQHQAMVDALSQGANNQPPDNGNGTNSNGNPKLAARDGSSQGLPPDLKTIAKGNPPPERAGPKPA